MRALLFQQNCSKFWLAKSQSHNDFNFSLSKRLGKIFLNNYKIPVSNEIPTADNLIFEESTYLKLISDTIKSQADLTIHTKRNSNHFYKKLAKIIIIQFILKQEYFPLICSQLLPGLTKRFSSKIREKFQWLFTAESLYCSTWISYTTTYFKWPKRPCFSTRTSLDINIHSPNTTQFSAQSEF